MRRALALAVAVSLWVGACSSSSPKDCVADGRAEVCLSINGGVQVTGEGLRPGSDLTVRVVDGPTQVVQVEETGSIGTLGFLTAVVPDSVTVEITGTTEGGEPLSGRLSVG